MQRYFYPILIGTSFTTISTLAFAFWSYKNFQKKIKNAVFFELNKSLTKQTQVISQLNQTNHLLEQSEKNLAVTLNSIADAVIATDVNCMVMRINKVAEQLTGWSQQEAIGRPVEEIFNIVNRYTREQVSSPVVEAISEAIVQYLPKDTLIISRSGEQYNIADTCAPIFDNHNQVQGAVLVFRDITQQEIAINKLRFSEELYRETFMHVSLGMAHVDTNGHFIRVNSCFVTITGYSEEQLLHMRLHDITHPEDLSNDVDLFEKIIAGEIKFYDIEKRYVKPDQTIVWINLTVSCVRKSNNEIDFFIAVVENITEKKQAIANSRRFFDLSQELLCIANLDGYFIAVNQTWEKVLGYSTAELMQRPFFDFIHPDDHASGRVEMGKFKDGHALLAYENRYICKNGEICHFLWSVTVDKENQLIYCSAHDITDRKEYEKNLIISANKFKTLLDAAPIGIYLMDQHFQIKHFNKVALDAFEPLSSLDGMFLKDMCAVLMDQHLIEPILAQFRLTLETGEAFYLKDYLNVNQINGDVKYWTWQINRITLTDENFGIVCYFQDVTERVLNEQRMIENQARFHTLFDRGPVAMYFCDTEGNIKEFNQYAAKIWGREPDPDQSDEDFRNNFKFYSLEGDLIPYNETYMMKVIDGSLLAVADREVVFERQDGAKFNVVINIVPIKNINGEIMGAMNCFIDVTYRKQSEDALVKYTVELKEAKAIAERANAAKSDFLSNMSHELRTPLNAILGFAQLMNSAQPTLALTPTQSQLNSIKQIMQGGWYLLDLINEILDLAQIESGQQPLSLEPVLLNDVIRECGMLIEPLANKNSVEVNFASIEGYTYVLSDKIRLKQVIINLLSNAIKYNKKGGLVSVDFAIKKDSIKVNVRDTGSGLTTKQISQLFEPFNRLGKDKNFEEGTGLGLTVSKRLIELMQGNIGVNSKVGYGSVFWISLTAIKKPKLFDASTALIPNKAYKKTSHDSVNQAENHVENKSHLAKTTTESDANVIKKILYIEDSKTNLFLVKEFVSSRKDMILRGASNGEEGLSIAFGWIPHVILLDINLPKMGGYDILKALIANADTANIPIIAISANAMSTDIQKGIEAGFFRYLTKPVFLNELMETLEFAFKYSNMKNLDQK